MRMLDEPVRGTIGDLGIVAIPGLDFMRRSARGEIAPPPIHHLTGLKPTSAGLGETVFTLPITPWLEDSAGFIRGGIVALAADAPLGTSLQTGLPPGKLVSTAELFVSFVHAARRTGGRLIARSDVIHLGGHIGLSHLRVENANGRLIAYGSTRCVVTDVPIMEGAEPMPPPEAITDPPDPYLRPVPEGLYCGAESLFDATPPVVLLKSFMAGELPYGPANSISGHELTSVDTGRVTMTAAASPWHSAGAPTMYGGAIAWFCDTVISNAIWSSLDTGVLFAMLDLEVRFFRPVPLDGAQLTGVGTVTHPGRQVRVGHAEITNAAGKPVAAATGSALVIPGGIAALHERLGDELTHHHDAS